MLPRWHIIIGALFVALIWFLSPNISWIYLSLLFLATFLMDFDHYYMAVKKTGKLSLTKAFRYHDEAREIEERERKKGLRRRGDFHIFHTIEFHILVGLLSFVWVGFFYILMGMIFHSLLDIMWLVKEDRVYRREYFLYRWLINSKRF